MAGIIEKNAKTPITIRRRSGIADGKPVFSEFPAVSMVFDSSSSDFNRTGAVQRSKVFLIPPLEIYPGLPCEVIHDGETYTIKSIKTITNIKGVLLGFRFASAGA